MSAVSQGRADAGLPGSRQGGMISTMTDHADLLVRIAARAREDDPMMPLKTGLPDPLSAGAIEKAEIVLGFRLHPLLAAIYRDVADGGFGPDYQLMSLIDGPTGEHAVSRYIQERTNNAGTEWAWPEGVLPILTWGCGM